VLLAIGGPLYFAREYIPQMNLFVSDATQECIAVESTLSKAREAFARECRDQERMDCDPIEGRWVCSNNNIPHGYTLSGNKFSSNNADECVASDINLNKARNLFVSQCAGFERRDCDPIDGEWICSSVEIDGNISNNSESNNTQPNPQSNLPASEKASENISQLDVCYASELSLADTILAFSRECSGYKRKDCDLDSDGRWICSSEQMIGGIQGIVNINNTSLINTSNQSDTLQNIGGSTNDNPSLGWKDSYSVNGQCYCDSGYDHGIGDVEVNTSQGQKTVREICNKIGEGPGASGNLIYNDIQCGNGPANNAGDEDRNRCPGRVDQGSSGCRIIGPTWNLEKYYPGSATSNTQVATTSNTAPTPAPVPQQEDTQGSGVCQAQGSSLNAARNAFAQQCNGRESADCDAINGGWLCSTEKITSNTQVATTNTTLSTPSNTDTSSNPTPITPQTNRDTYWQKNGYDLVWSNTPSSRDIGTSVEQYLRSDAWSGGQPLAKYTTQSQTEISIATAPDGSPSLKSLIRKGDNFSMIARGKQFGDKGTDKNIVFSGEWYTPCVGGNNRNGRSGTYIGFGHHWGSADNVQHAPGGGTNYDDAWTLRGILTTDNRYSIYAYIPDKNNKYGIKFHTNVSPRCDQWELIEMEVIQNTPVSAENGSVRMYINGSLEAEGKNIRIRAQETVKPKGYGIYIGHIGNADADEAYYLRNWKMYTR